MPSRDEWILYAQNWRWYERNNRPLHKFKIARELAQRKAFARMPIHGDILEGLLSGRLEIGEFAHFEPHVWITMDVNNAHVKIGSGCFLNIGVMIAAQESVSIGDHTMVGNGCFIGDAAHNYDDAAKPITWQGFTSNGPVTIGANCWLGVNSVVLGGVSIGDRCVIGANSVVNEDIPAGTIAVGAPAKVIKQIEFRNE